MDVKNDVLEVRCVKLKQRVSKSQSELVLATEIARQRRKAVAIGKAQCEASPRTKQTSFFSFECEHRCWTMGTQAEEPMGFRKWKLCDKHLFCLLPQPSGSGWS